MRLAYESHLSDLCDLRGLNIAVVYEGVQDDNMIISYINFLTWCSKIILKCYQVIMKLFVLLEAVPYFDAY